MRNPLHNPLTYVAVSPRNVDDAIAAARKETRDAIIAQRELMRAEESAAAAREQLAATVRTTRKLGDADND